MLRIHPELYLDWCEGLVCNGCITETHYRKRIGNLWLCKPCLRKVEGLWNDKDPLE